MSCQVNTFMDALVFIPVESDPPGHNVQMALGEWSETVPGPIITSGWQKLKVFLCSIVFRRKA